MLAKGLAEELAALLEQPFINGTASGSVGCSTQAAHSCLFGNNPTATFFVVELFPKRQLCAA